MKKKKDCARYPFGRLKTTQPFNSRVFVVFMKGENDQLAFKTNKQKYFPTFLQNNYFATTLYN